MTMTNLSHRFVRENEGQHIIEYAMLFAFISVVAYTLVVIIGQDGIVHAGTLATASAAGSSPIPA
jgi:Flp pilus assembly pilin Flp